MKRKGISPLIASVLLIVFVVAISSIFLSWVREYTSNTQTDIDTSSAELLDCGQQAVEIKDVYMVPTPEGSEDPHKYRILVENTGQKKTTLLDMFMLTTEGEKCEFASAPDTEIEKGTSTVIENADCGDIVDFPHGCGKFFQVEVKTACGSECFNRYERPVSNGTRVVLSEY